MGEEEAKKQGCSRPVKVIAIGCGTLVVLAIVLLVIVIINFRKIAAGTFHSVAVRAVRESQLEEDQKRDVIRQIDKLAGEFKDEKITMEQLGAIAEELAEGPLMPLGVLMVVRATYIEPSGLSEEEKKDAVLQGGNERDKLKIKPKKSWELKDNRIGSMPCQLPRLPMNDYQPHLPINIHDNDFTTRWCSREQGRSDVEPEWVRLDLAKEQKIKEIRLYPGENGQGFPQKLAIKASQDAWHWTTLSMSEEIESGGDDPMIVKADPPVAAKQVWIIGENLTPNIILLSSIVEIIIN